jgi:putative ABC transport system permease protein
MTTPWRKVLRDVWQERARAVLVVAAISMGIAAFSAVLSTYAILDRELNRGYLDTNPASATLRTDAIDDELLKVVAESPLVEAVEARRVVTARIKAGPAQWRSLLLFVVKNYADIRISTINRESGAWPPAAGEILIERDAFQVAKARVGDVVTVRTPRGAFQTLRVSGGVHDVGQAQARMENMVYGYITLETLALLGEEPYLDQLQILVSGDRFDRAHITAVAGEVRKLLEARGHPVRRVDIPDPGKHPHADLMAMLLLAISSFGLLVLALSGVLVVTLLTALMASQVRQIGVMKAIGGTTRQIASIYLGQALLLGLAAVAVAAPLGMLGARALCRYLAVFLNFDLLSFAVPFWVYALVALVGVLAPLLAAAYPVAKGARVTVVEALSDFGVAGGGFGVGGFDRALVSVGGSARPVLFAVRNSFRRRTRLALTLLTLCVGGVFFMAALNVRASMINTLDHLFGARKFDLAVSLASMSAMEPIERAAAASPGSARVEGWIATEASFVSKAPAAATATPGQQHQGGGGRHGESSETIPRFQVLGIKPSTSFLKLDIVEGRNLLPEDTDALVLNSTLATRNPGLRVGQTVTLRMGPAESSFRVVGLAREAFGPPVAYIPRSLFDRAGHAGQTNSVRVTLEGSGSAAIDAFREAFDRNLEAAGIRALSASSKAESRYGFDQHMLMVYLFLVVMSGIIGGVGGLGLMTTMSLNVLERRREMGVLRAIGASSGAVWLIVVAEGLSIGLMSFVIALGLAWPISRGLGDFIAAAMFQGGLNFRFDPSGPLVWFAVSLVLSVAASFLPAWNASRSSVREALGFE